MRITLLKPVLFALLGLVFINSSAQTLYEQKVFNSPETQQFISAIEQHPDSMKLHERFIERVKGQDMSNPLLPKQYQLWIQRFPRVATIPLALGEAYGPERPETESYLLRAVAIDSTHAEAWEMLAVIAGIKGDDQTATADWARAHQLKPNNAGYAANYAYCFKNTDPEKYLGMLQGVAGHFPKTLQGAQALNLIAEAAKDTASCLAALEKISADYGISLPTSRSAMDHLYALYLQTQPTKAISMSKRFGWKARGLLAQTLVAADSLAALQNYTASIALLDSVNRIKGLTIDNFYNEANFLLQKRSALLEASGQPDSAYHVLLAGMVKNPSADLFARLKSFGLRSGKTEASINQDLWSMLTANAKFVPNFRSKMYTQDQSVAMGDYRGKVVLLTFWFPGCGPCRAEFPHFESVLKQFDRSQVAYVGVNSMPDQDAFVLPIIKQSNLTFTALHGRADVVEKLFGFTGYPANFLIDQQGRIIYSHFMIGEKDEETLAMMISLAINNGNKLPVPADAVKIADTSGRKQ